MELAEKLELKYGAGAISSPSHRTNASFASTAELNVAEQLVDGPRTAQEIAGAMGVHAPSLHRLMRALAAVGVLTQDDGERFALAAVGQFLRSDAPGSFRAMAMLLGRQWHHTAWASLAHSVRTGGSAFRKVYRVPHFEWLQANAEEGAIYHGNIGPSAPIARRDIVRLAR